MVYLSVIPLLMLTTQYSPWVVIASKDYLFKKINNIVVDVSCTTFED